MSRPPFPSSGDDPAEAKNAPVAPTHRPDQPQVDRRSQSENTIALKRVVHVSQEIVGEQARQRKANKLDWGFLDLLTDAQITPANWHPASEEGSAAAQSAPTNSDEPYSSQAIHHMFDLLQKHFGRFPMFEDVPDLVLDVEKASEAQLDENPMLDRKKTAV